MPVGGGGGGDGDLNTASMIMQDRILCWNCRGAGNKDFLREILDLIRSYNPSIVVLLEPRISGSGANDVCKRLGKTHWIRSEADGFSGGGVWLLWNEDAIRIELRNVHKSFIHVAINPSSRGCWLFTATYASPIAHIRNELWPVMNDLQIDHPWLLMEDFNYVLKGSERSFGSGISENFANWVLQRGLIDLGFSGHNFTWSHGRSADNRRVARLDIGLCDTEWTRHFPMASVKHLTHSYSNHCPLLLQLIPDLGERVGPRPFLFQAMWLHHKNFPRWLSENWSCEGGLTEMLHDLKFKLQEWNKQTFGNVF